MTATERPTLGELKVGAEVFVRRSSNEMRGRDASERYIPAKVTKASRIWIELQEVWAEGHTHEFITPRTWRMRRDKQDEGTQYPDSDASFVTPAQREYDDRASEARSYLAEHGIRVERGSWYGREVELADLLRAHEESR